MFKKLKFFSQRGAMFGLDARIALAIFGTLAIVSGYVGISKFQTAKDAAFMKELFAVEEAMELMQTDLGVFYDFAMASGNTPQEKLLALNDVSYINPKYQSRWNGPYLEGLEQPNRYTNTDYRLFSTQVDLSTGCNISNACYMMIVLGGVPGSLWDRINRMVDENNGSAIEASPVAEGRVRSGSALGADPKQLLYRTTLVRQAG